MPWGYWLPLVLRRVDVRTLGSGNAGATNVWRTLGFKMGLAVALLDIAKGSVAAVLGLWLGSDLVGVLAGVAAMVGHWRPLFLGFARGGKIVATTGGVALAVAPFAALSAAGVWILLFLAFRYASVSSMAAAVSLPLFAWLYGASWPVLAFTGGSGAGDHPPPPQRTSVAFSPARSTRWSSAARGSARRMPWAPTSSPSNRVLLGGAQTARSQSPSSV